MLLDKSQGYIFRIKDVKQAKAVVAVLVSQGYEDEVWSECSYGTAIAYNMVANPNDTVLMTNPLDYKSEIYNWVDTEMFLKYSTPEVKETIQVGDTIFDKEEFQQATAHLKGVKV